MSFRTGDWTEFKNQLSARNGSLQFKEKTNKYIIDLYDGNDIVFRIILSRDGGADVTDFENNFKSSANQKLTNFSYTSGDLNVTAGNDASNPVSANPCLSTKARIDSYFGPDVDLNNSGESFTTVYSYSGSGKLFCGMFEFNSDRIQFKLTIDSEVIFDLDLEDVEDFFPSSGDSSGGNTGAGSTCWVSWNASKNTFKFMPTFPIEYSTQVLFEARANSSSNSREYERYMVELTKES